MSETPECVVVGGAMVDEHYAVSNLPEPDGGAFARDVERTFGGVGANVAVALDRLGRDVGLVSRVGDDERGEDIREHLAATGIDTTHVAVGDDATTYSVILRDPDGERMIVTTGESFRELRLDEKRLEYVANAEVVFLTAYAPDAVAAAILERAGDPDFPSVAFDLSGPVEELLGRGTAPATIDGFLHRSDLFVAGDVATESFFGGHSAAVDRVAGADVERAALTHSADGVTVVVDDESTDLEAFDVGVVDTTGAGDAFVAGLIDRWLLAGDEEASAVRFAAATAAINCTSRFAQPGLPDRETVREFLSRRS